MGANDVFSGRLAVAQLINSTRVTDATPVSSTAFNRAALTAGVRVLLVLSAFETNVANTGGVWTVTESATSGGSYTAAALSTALTATPATAGNDIQTTDVMPNSAKPWIKVTYTGADANAEVDITAVRVLIPRSVG